MRPDLRTLPARLAARARAAAAALEARAQATPWLARTIEVARRRPDALLAAALVAGVAAMVVHWG